MKKGIMFDLDGTLWEVTKATYEAVNKVAEKYNLDHVSIHTVKSIFGLNDEEVSKRYFPRLKRKERLKLLNEISVYNDNILMIKGGHLYDNVNETIKELSLKYDLFIVSNTGHDEYIEAFLITTGLKEYFKGYVAASKIKISKSDALKKVIEENNLDKYVYVGDTKLDYEESKKANCPFIHAKYGFNKELETKYYINEFKELPNLVENLFK